jgi:F0F1-type ATP synthase assembly protein I
VSKYVGFLALGSEIIGLILVGVWVGSWLDRRTSNQGLWTGVLVIVALVLWFVRIILLLRRKQND